MLEKKGNHSQIYQWKYSMWAIAMYSLKTIHMIQDVEIKHSFLFLIQNLNTEKQYYAYTNFLIIRNKATNNQYKRWNRGWIASLINYCQIDEFKMDYYSQRKWFKTNWSFNNIGNNNFLTHILLNLGLICQAGRWLEFCVWIITRSMKPKICRKWAYFWFISW